MAWLGLATKTNSLSLKLFRSLKRAHFETWSQTAVTGLAASEDTEYQVAISFTLQ